jgi:hypothetical protein
LIVLVAIASAVDFSVKEKDETSHPSVSGGFAFSRRFAGAEGFSFSAPALVSCS